MQQVRYPVCQIDELVPDVGKVVKLGPDGECALFLHAGRVYAVGSLCPHQNASLEAAPSQEGWVTCRRHGYRFDLSSGDCLTLGGYGLPTYRVDLEESTLYVTCWEFD